MVAHQAGMARTQGTGPADSKTGAWRFFKTLRAGEPEGHGPQQGNCIPDLGIVHRNRSGRPVWAKLRSRGRQKPCDGRAPGSVPPTPARPCLFGGGGLTWAESVGCPDGSPSDLFLKRRPELEAAVDGPLAAEEPAAADLIAPSQDRLPPPLSAISRPDFSTRSAQSADERQRGDPYVSGEVRAMAPGSPGSPSPPHQPVATPDTAAARCPWQRHSDPPTGRSTAAWRSLSALP